MLAGYDTEEAFCVKLGHEVPFRYCRQAGNLLPCREIVRCWFNHLPIEEFLLAHYSAEERAAIFAPPKSKMAALADLIDRAKKVT